MARPSRLVIPLGTHGGASSSTFSNGSSITATQVAFGDATGKLTSSAALTMSGQTLVIGDGTSAPVVSISGVAGSASNFNLQTAGGNRWKIYRSAGAESGANAGSALAIDAFDDSATKIDTIVFVTRAANGTWQFSRPVTNNFTEATAATPGLTHTATTTITGGVTDAYATSIRLTPTYSAATALTVARHNYLDIQQPTLAGVGPAALTDACVFRFNAAIGTHKAVDTGSTKTSPGTVTAWVKVNINGTIHFMPAYSSKTT